MKKIIILLLVVGVVTQATSQFKKTVSVNGSITGETYWDCVTKCAKFHQKCFGITIDVEANKTDRIQKKKNPRMNWIGLCYVFSNFALPEEKRQ